MAFEGYSAEALDFLEALPTRDPDWFMANKKDYQGLIADPTKELVVDIGEALRVDVPGIVAEPKTNGSIAPINNDLRFAPDKAPYKDHLLLRFWEGAPKKTAPTLFVRLSPSDVGFAAGIVPADVDAWRRVIDSPVGETIAATTALLRKGKKAEVVGEELKRVPAPYAADHPRADLLRHKYLQVRWVRKLPTAVSKPTFGEWCAAQLAPALELHRALVEGFG